MFVCLSVRPKRFLVIRCRDHIGWNTSKIISPQNSDKIVMWRFLRNRRLFLRLHRLTIFRALTYWAHRAVIIAIAWFPCVLCKQLFHTPLLFRLKFGDVPLAEDPWYWGLRRAYPNLISRENIFEEFQSTWSQYVIEHRRTDRWTIYDGNSTLCGASRGKNFGGNQKLVHDFI